MSNALIALEGAAFSSLSAFAPFAAFGFAAFFDFAAGAGFFFAGFAASATRARRETGPMNLRHAAALALVGSRGADNRQPLDKRTQIPRHPHKVHSVEEDGICFRSSIRSYSCSHKAAFLPAFATFPTRTARQDFDPEAAALSR